MLNSTIASKTVTTPNHLVYIAILASLKEGFVITIQVFHIRNNHPTTDQSITDYAPLNYIDPEPIIPVDIIPGLITWLNATPYSKLILAYFPRALAQLSAGAISVMDFTEQPTLF